VNSKKLNLEALVDKNLSKSSEQAAKEDASVKSVLQRFRKSATVAPPAQDRSDLDQSDLQKIDTPSPHDPVSTQPGHDDPVVSQPGLDLTPSFSNPVAKQPGTVEPVIEKRIEQPIRKTTPSRSDPVIKQPPRQMTRSANDPLPGYRVPNIISDEIIQTLGLPEQTVLWRLYRLSYGFNRQTTDPVGVGRLAEKCNLGETAVKKALKDLQLKRLIIIHQDTSGNPKGGNRYTVLPGLLSDPVAKRPGSIETGLSGDHIKDHEDLNNTSDHQEKTMRLYEELTGNYWTRADQSAYQKIQNVSLNRIEAGIKRAMERAASRPGSLAYFCKEIINPSLGQPQKYDRKRAQLQKIIEQVREARVGIGSEYTTELFRQDVERACGREGVIFDPDLFNEIVGRTG
jgi:hypothetical protein